QFPALLAGKVNEMFNPLPPSIEHKKEGNRPPFAVTTAERWDPRPNAPAMSEFVPGYSGSGWNGFGAPPNTPPEIIAMLNKEINAGLADSRIEARFAERCVMPITMTPVEFGKFMAEETEKWGKVIRTANIKPH